MWENPTRVGKYLLLNNWNLKTKEIELNQSTTNTIPKNKKGCQVGNKIMTIQGCFIHKAIVKVYQSSQMNKVIEMSTTEAKAFSQKNT